MRQLTTLWIGPYEIALWEYDEPIDDSDPDAVYASVCRPREIRVHERVKGRERTTVVLHELVHAAISLFDVPVKKRAEEPLCEAVSFVIGEALAGAGVLTFDERSIFDGCARGPAAQGTTP